MQRRVRSLAFSLTMKFHPAVAHGLLSNWHCARRIIVLTPRAPSLQHGVVPNLSTLNPTHPYVSPH